MHVLICSERLLFRFGVDRVLIMLGRTLKERGHTVSVMAVRYDPAIVKTFASGIIDVPGDDAEYMNLDNYTSSWVERTWSAHFEESDRPDLVLTAGWPFFSAISFFRDKKLKIVYLDCGAVPLDGYTGYALAVQEKLRDLRRLHLKEADFIVGISDFIARSQSVVDSFGGVPVRAVPLFADHLEKNIWAESLSNTTGQGTSEIVGTLKRRGKKVILNLGRWEPNCYKNSEAAFGLMRSIRLSKRDSALLILAGREQVDIPPDLKDVVFPVGFPADRELIDMMRQADLGISLSLWEGFNLPLAEMQWLGKPALAFDLAAHPEVIVHPWYLCRDISNMAAKAAVLLAGGGPDSAVIKEAISRFKRIFTFERFMREIAEVFESVVRGCVEGPVVTLAKVIEEKKPVNLVIDVTFSSVDTANNGPIRVTRRLSRALQFSQDPLFVRWEASLNQYVLLTRQEYHQLSRFNGPMLFDEMRLSAGSGRVGLEDRPELFRKGRAWLLLPEIMNHESLGRISSFARRAGVRTAAIFYDAIPLLHPDFCGVEIKDNHDRYMKELAGVDVVIPISDYSDRCLHDFWNVRRISGGSVEPSLLPAEFGGVSRNLNSPRALPHEIKILCVSTLEPRKNHLRLLRACRLLQERHPELSWSLTLVGKRYADDGGTAEAVETAAKENPRIQWLGVVDDETLHHLYEESAFTVYPSMIEGFGMPIVESLWHGRPCICHKEGVMAELASEGGCLTVDVMDEKDLCDAIYRLATDEELYTGLARQAVSRRMKTWDDYSREILAILRSKGEIGEADGSLPPELRDIIFRGWPENPSEIGNRERLVVEALLSRLSPQCCIGVNADVASLSLLARHSAMVFSIGESDPDDRLSCSEKVSLIDGPTSVVLPLLLKELDASDIPVDLVLIQGYSEEGLAGAIEPLLSYAPRGPLFMLIYGCFDPSLRQIVTELKWEKSLYVHVVDIDFIPGGMKVGGGSSPEPPCGGLAMVYLSPAPRMKNLKVNISAEPMFRKLSGL